MTNPYTVMAICDEHTCDACLSHRGKVVSAETAELTAVSIGHHCDSELGCRCTLVAMPPQCYEWTDDEGETWRVDSEGRSYNTERPVHGHHYASTIELLRLATLAGLTEDEE